MKLRLTSRYDGARYLPHSLCYRDQNKAASIKNGFVCYHNPEMILLLLTFSGAGRPHNIVCSECRLPDSLIGCQTCCRSYHTACLADVVRSANAFYCPSCRERAWDHAPPQFSLPPSASGSPRGTNSGVQSPQKQDSPFGSTSIRAEGSPAPPRPTFSFSRMAPPGLNRIDDYDSGLAPDKLPPVAEMYPQVLEYLNRPGAQTDQFAQLQFKNQLGLMMKEIESYRSLLQDQANLREDHLRLQTENTKIRAYLNSSLAPREPALASPSTFSHSIPRPPTETRGKSWDSIALDLI